MTKMSFIWVGEAEPSAFERSSLMVVRHQTRQHHTRLPT